MSKKFVLKDDDSANSNTNSSKSESNQAMVVTATDIQLKPITTDFDSAMYGIVQHGGLWKVLEVPFNTKTNQTGEWKYLTDDGTKAGAIGLFKLTIYKAGLLNG